MRYIHIALSTTLSTFLLLGTARTRAANDSVTPNQLLVQINRACPAAGTEGPEGAGVDAIIGAIAQPALSAVFDGLGDALLSASGTLDSTYSISGTGRTYAYSISPATGVRIPNKDFGCIVAYVPKKAAAPTIPTIDDTSFYLEFLVQNSNDGLGFGVAPVSLYYPRRFSKGRDVLEMSAAIEFIGIDGKAFAATTIPLKRLPKEDKLDRNDLAGLEGPWLPVKAPSKDNEDSRLLYASNIAKKDATSVTLATGLRARLAKHEPISVKVTITETKDVSKFLAAVGNILKTQKTDLAKAASPVVFSTLATSTKAADQKSGLSAASAYAVARITFDEKVAIYSAVKSQPGSAAATLADAKIAAIQAKYDLLKSAVDAGISVSADDSARTFNP